MANRSVIWDNVRYIHVLVFVGAYRIKLIRYAPILHKDFPNLFLVHLIAEQTDNLVAHGFLARRAEMDIDFENGAAYTLHKTGRVGFGRCGRVDFIVTHIIISFLFCSVLVRFSACIAALNACKSSLKSLPFGGSFNAV